MFALTKLELRRPLDAVDIATPFGRRDYLLIRFLSQTALRVGECAGLLTCLVADNGTPRHYLHLPAAICKGSRGRVVPLNAVARACIAKQLAFNSERGFSTAPASPLFQNRCHGPLSVRSIQSLDRSGNAALSPTTGAAPGSMSGRRRTPFATRRPVR